LRSQDAGRPVAARDIRSVTMVFGSKDAAPEKWDGSVKVIGGRILRLAGYHFSPECSITGENSWKCSTQAWGAPGPSVHIKERPGPYPTMVQPVGITLEFTGAGEPEIVVTSHRSFRFRYKELPDAGALYEAGGNVELYRTSPMLHLTTAEFEDDYPSLAVSASGQAWLAWQAYHAGAERVLLRERSSGPWGKPITVTERPGDLFMTAVAATGSNATVVWSEFEDQAWRLKARVVEGERLGATEILAKSGNNLFHRMVADRAGNLHLVWQSWRGGPSDVYMRTRTAGHWGPELRITNGGANHWSPAVAADSRGTVWVAWDGYDARSYNVYLRPVRGGVPGAIIPVTQSGRFHAHPSIAVDAQDRVWVAWDQASENWSKDQGYFFSGGTGIYTTRTIRVAVYAGGQWLTTLTQPDADLPSALQRYFHTPRLVCDARGRMWLLARPRSAVHMPSSLIGIGGKWEVFAMYYAGDHWSDVIPIPESVGRAEAEIAAAADRNGDVLAAVVTDGRLWDRGRFAAPGEAKTKEPEHDVVLASLRSDAPVAASLLPRVAEPPTMPLWEPRERQQIETLRRAGVWRGDLHRHTDASDDGAGDGSLWDAYRYAMDGAGLDFLMVTDHQSGDGEYAEWRIGKSADMFHVPGYFTALYGTERSVGYPNGHRNLIFTRRNIPILPITETNKDHTGPLLYPFLRRYDGISMPHTTSLGAGMDWKDNDPDLEPLVEIFQGARTSSEYENAPLGESAVRPAARAPREGYLWQAWAKGYKLGVQASSDHVSTHASYVCLVAADRSREKLLDAIRKRHSYGATANILLDFRGQGEVTRTATLPELSARIVGTAPLARVVLIRDNKFIFTAEPAAEQYPFHYRENALDPGEHYYYVRVEQKDGNVAWSSPVWINYAPAKQ